MKETCKNDDHGELKHATFLLTNNPLQMVLCSKNGYQYELQTNVISKACFVFLFTNVKVNGMIGCNTE